MIHIKRACFFAIPLLLTSGVALAGQSTGNQALALAALLGSASPILPHAEKTLLEHFLAGDTHAPLITGATRLTVTVDKIECRMGDVDIGLHDCELTFGAKTVTRTGRAGQELLATLQENGIQGDGAAGTIYFAAAPITCTIDASEVENHDGGGATCTFMGGAESSAK